MNEPMNKNEFIRATISGYEKFRAASEALNEAHKQIDDAWREYLNTQTGSPFDLSERVIALHDGELYEIQFDIEDFSTPTVSRVGNYVEYYEVAAS